MNQGIHVASTGGWPGQAQQQGFKNTQSLATTLTNRNFLSDIVPWQLMVCKYFPFLWPVYENTQADDLSQLGNKVRATGTLCRWDAIWLQKRLKTRYDLAARTIWSNTAKHIKPT